MKLKRRCCKQCKEIFQPNRPLMSVCGYACATKYAKALQEKKQRKEHNKAKKSLLTHSDWLNILQKVFNTWIRIRDCKKPCVSCGCSMVGKKGDASHFYSVGSNPSVRFNENNVHLSCVHCNQHLHGNIHLYSERLPERIGIENFNALKADRNKP